MATTYVYPQTVCESFLSAVEEYRINGQASHPVLDMKMMVSMLNTIRVAPKDAWDFITQVTNMITDAVFEKYSDDPEFANRTIREWDNVMTQFFIVSLNKSLNDVEQLNSVVDELIAGKSTTSGDGVPIPDVDPSEVFKGIEWINMKEWITPDASA